MKKTFAIDASIIKDPPNLNYLMQLKDEMFEPVGSPRLLVDRDTGMANLVLNAPVEIVKTAGGKSKRNKSKRRRNTKKNYNQKKIRSSQKKNNKKRTSRKIR
jgi:uncharacterized protein YaiI (UPF0178 family)